ncbi:hypothetical protein Q1695_013462 [Nippostrongylus brasiliensis]|nr:hypothetical protein Q1695_013462 [Nippostrongylus brasiliensis]
MPSGKNRSDEALVQAEEMTPSNEAENRRLAAGQRRRPVRRFLVLRAINVNASGGLQEGARTRWGALSV